MRGGGVVAPVALPGHLPSGVPGEVAPGNGPCCKTPWGATCEIEAVGW